MTYYRGVPNYYMLWIDRSIATQRPPNPLDLFIATQSLPNEILLSRTIGNIHMGRVLVPAVLNHAQARINYGTGTAFFFLLRAVPVPVPCAPQRAQSFTDRRNMTGAPMFR